MKVILLVDVKGLGRKDEIKEVSDGYARNFLFPKKLAVQHSSASAEVLNTQIETRKENDRLAKEKALAEAEILKGINLRFTLKAGEGGRVFGSITTKHIKEKIESEHHIMVDRKKIDLERNLDFLGSSIVKIELYKGVIAPVRVTLEAE